jgi:hypothetical protein
MGEPTAQPTMIKDTEAAATGISSLCAHIM